jgi:hypothetical protein
MIRPPATEYTKDPRYISSKVIPGELYWKGIVAGIGMKAGQVSHIAFETSTKTYWVSLRFSCI